jgi:hypothetical protein
MPRTMLPFLGWVLFAAPALAGNLDQSNEGPVAGSTAIGVIGSSFSQSAAQTITVGFDGWLDGASIFINAAGQLTSPLVLEIHPVAGGVPTDEILAAAAGTANQNGPQWVGFDFSATPVRVTQGQQIALVLNSGQDLTRGEYDAERTHDLYAGGSSFVSNSGGPWIAGNDSDLMFRTYVNPSLTFCCTADYNGDDIWGDDSDIEDFFACLAGDCCGTCPANGDFNCDGDIESFFRVLAGGSC